MNLLGTDAPQLIVSVAHMEQMSSPVQMAWLGVRSQMTALMTVTTTVLAKMLEPQLWDQQQLSKTVLHCVRAMETLPCPPPAAPGTSVSVTMGWRASPSPASLTGSSATPWAPVWMLPTARRTAVLSPILCGAEHMLFEALNLIGNFLFNMYK